ADGRAQIVADEGFGHGRPPARLAPLDRGRRNISSLKHAGGDSFARRPHLVLVFRCNMVTRATMIHRGHVSMQRIAEELGVSRATVSNELRGRGRVSEGLAACIRDRAEDLGFVPSAAGRALRDGRSLTVGLVVPDFAMPLFPTFVQAIESAARARGLALMVAEAASDPARQQEAVADLIARGVDALCVIPM